MASVIFTTEAAKKQLNPRADQPRNATPAADLPLLHFGLRQLFLFVAAMSALLAALVSSHGVSALVLLLFAVIVVTHIFATALASRLRSRADREIVRGVAEWVPANSIASATERLAKLAAVQSAPRSPWHARGSTVLPWLPRVIVGAMTFGGLAGALLLAISIGHRITPAGIIVGACSLAVLSGWFAFLCGSFYGVFRHGFREALAEQQRDEPPVSSRR